MKELAVKWYLDTIIREEDKEDGTHLDISRTWHGLSGCLDLSEFPNLTDLNASHNYKISSINLTKNNKLEVIELYINNITADLSSFSHMTNLKKLDFGTRTGKSNNFYGSLKSLEKCKQLEYLCIGQNSGIQGGLEYLPLENLKYFCCHGTVFQGMLRPFDYDIKAWKLFMHPNLITADKEKLIKQLNDKLEKSQLELKELKENRSTRLKKVQRLESKIRLLETKNNELLINFQEQMAIVSS